MAQVRTEFVEHLERLRTAILRIGTLADRMLENAIAVMSRRDADLAVEVLRQDDEADSIDAEVERETVLLIALQQPVACDLRAITTALKVVNEIERIGDYAVDIAKIGRRILRRGQCRQLVDIVRLASWVRGMLRDALTGFVNGDTELLRRVIAADDTADDLYHQYRDYLIETMERNSATVYEGAFTLLACKYLERVGDHIVNIAEDAYYMHTGEVLVQEKKRKWQTNQQDEGSRV